MLVHLLVSSTVLVFQLNNVHNILYVLVCTGHNMSICIRTALSLLRVLLGGCSSATFVFLSKLSSMASCFDFLSGN